MTYLPFDLTAPVAWLVPGLLRRELEFWGQPIAAHPPQATLAEPLDLDHVRARVTAGTALVVAGPDPQVRRRSQTMLERDDGLKVSRIA